MTTPAAAPRRGPSDPSIAPRSPVATPSSVPARSPVERRQQHLRLRVAEARVELEHHRPVIGDHQSGVQHATVRSAVASHHPGDRLEDGRHDLVERIGPEPGHRRVGAHAAGVGSRIAVLQPLVVASRSAAGRQSCRSPGRMPIPLALRARSSSRIRDPGPPSLEQRPDGALRVLGRIGKDARPSRPRASPPSPRDGAGSLLGARMRQCAPPRHRMRAPQALGLRLAPSAPWRMPWTSPVAPPRGSVQTPGCPPGAARRRHPRRAAPRDRSTTRSYRSLPAWRATSRGLVGSSSGTVSATAAVPPLPGAMRTRGDVVVASEPPGQGVLTTAAAQHQDVEAAHPATARRLAVRTRWAWARACRRASAAPRSPSRAR